MIKECKNCGKEFEILEKNKYGQKYCSVKCRKEFYKKPKKKVREQKIISNFQDSDIEEIENNKDLYTVLGVMLIDRVFLLWCFKHKINDDFFRTEKSKILFSGIKISMRKHRFADILTVTEAIREMGLLGVVTPYFVTSIPSRFDNKNKAYAIMKSVLNYQEVEPIIKDEPQEYNSDILNQFRNNPESKKAFEELTLPTTGAYQRQFYAGYVRAFEIFKKYFEQDNVIDSSQYIEEEKEEDIFGLKKNESFDSRPFFDNEAPF